MAVAAMWSCGSRLTGTLLSCCPLSVTGEAEAYGIDLGRYGMLRLVRETTAQFALLRRFRPTTAKHFTRTERITITADTLLAAFRAADTIIDRRFGGTARLYT